MAGVSSSSPGDRAALPIFLGTTYDGCPLTFETTKASTSGFAKKWERPGDAAPESLFGHFWIPFLPEEADCKSRAQAWEQAICRPTTILKFMPSAVARECC